MLKSLSKAASTVSTKTGLEAAYVKNKTAKNGFQHIEEVAQWIVVLNRIRTQTALRDKLAKIMDDHAGLSKDEDKSSTEFINLSSDAQSAAVGQLFKIWGDAHQRVAQKRQQFADEVARIKDEWKAIENVDIKNCNSLEEKANRTWSDKNYYVGHNDKDKIGPAEELYATASSELVAAVRELDSKLQGSYVLWFRRIAKAEADFLSASAALILDSSEASNGVNL
jgi:hypothetical protein